VWAGCRRRRRDSACRCAVFRPPGGPLLRLSPGDAVGRPSPRRGGDSCAGCHWRLVRQCFRIAARSGAASAPRGADVMSVRVPFHTFARRPPGGGRRSTRGYIPPPLRGGPRRFPPSRRSGNGARTAESAKNAENGPACVSLSRPLPFPSALSAGSALRSFVGPATAAHRPRRLPNRQTATNSMPPVRGTQCILK